MWKLVNEFTQRREAGEKPTIEEYCRDHPQLADEIRDLFPTVMELGDLSESDSVFGIQAKDPLPEKVGDYRVIREIGRGGMGVVYEAEHAALGRHVALKVLPRRFSNDQRALSRFRREGQMIAKLHHTNIVPLYEADEDDGVAYLAMQLINGNSLDHLIHDLSQATGQTRVATTRAGSVVERSVTDLSVDGQSSVSKSFSSSGSRGRHGNRAAFETITRIGLQAAEALSYAHKREVIHRDIKPSNLLYDETGVAWLTDFGLAKLQEEEAEDGGMTRTGDVLGTLKYMPPERFQGECDARSDIYSLGLTLYELATGKPAFQSSDRLNLIKQITQEEPARPRAINRNVPRDLETIILKAINKEPAERYQSSRLLADDLRRFLRDEPIQARRISWLEHSVRWAKKNKGLATALAALAALLVFAFVREGILRREAVEARTVAEDRGVELEEKQQELQRNLYLAEMALAGQSASDWRGLMTIKPQLQRWHPDRVGVDLRGWEWYYLDSISRREQFSSEQTGWTWTVDYNPAGTEFVNCVNAWGIQVRDADTGEVVRQLNLGSARCAEWSPDGTQIAVSGFFSSIRICDARTLEVIKEINASDCKEVFSVAWSPDMKRIASCERTDGTDRDNDVKIWDTNTGKLVQTLKGHAANVYDVQWNPQGDKLASVGGTLKIWDTNSWNELNSWDENSWSVAWSPDGKRIASGNNSFVIRNLSESAESTEPVVLKFEDKNNGAFSSCWNVDSTKMAIGHADGTLRIYDANSGEQQEVLSGHTQNVRSVAWSANADRLASGSLDMTVRMWSLEKVNQTQSISEEGARFLRWSHSGERLASCQAWAKTVLVFDPRTQEKLTIDSDANRVEQARWSPDDRRLAYGGLGFLRIRDFEESSANTSAATADFESFRERHVAGLDWSPNGKLLACRTMNTEELIICDSDSGEWHLQQSDIPMRSLQWHPERMQLAVGSTQGHIRVINPDGSIVWEQKRETDITTVSFSGDGSKLATSEEHAIVIWDSESGDQLSVLESSAEAFSSIDWSPDSRRLVASSTSSVSIVDVASGLVTLRFAEPSTMVHWNPDGQRIAACIEGDSVRIWDATPNDQQWSIEK